MAEFYGSSTTQGHPLLQREERAYRRLDNFRTLIREAYEFILPRMPHDLDAVDATGGVAPERPAVTDNTATDAAFAYADRFMTRYTPPNESFVGLRPGIQIEFFAPAVMEEARNLLDQTMEMFHRLLEISNFHQVVHRSYLDYAISAGCFNFNERANPNDPFVFETVPLPQITPEEGPSGTARTSFRRFKILPQNIMGTWPDAKLSDEMSRAAENPTDGPDRRFLFVEGLVWNEKADRYDYTVVDKASGKVIVERRVGDGARVIFRNMLPSNAVLGIGPGIRQLPNIRQLNKTVELWLWAQEMDAMSVYEAPMDHPMYGQGGVIDMAPGLVIPYMNAGLTPLARTGGQHAVEESIGRLQGHIRQAFGDDNLPPLGGKVISPTEIVQRTRDELERFEPSATRLDAEMLRPTTRRGIAIMQRQGIIPNFRIDGLRVKIMADGPLSRLRRQNEARQRLLWASEVAQGLGADVVLAATDAEAFAADLLSDGGIEPKFVLDDDERAERHEMLMQEQLMLVQAQAAQQAA